MSNEQVKPKIHMIHRGLKPLMAQVQVAEAAFDAAHTASEQDADVVHGTLAHQVPDDDDATGRIMLNPVLARDPHVITHNAPAKAPVAVSADATMPSIKLLVAVRMSDGGVRTKEILNMDIMPAELGEVSSDDNQAVERLASSFIGRLKKSLVHLPLTVAALIQKRKSPIKALRQAIRASEQLTHELKAELEAVQVSLQATCQHPATDEIPSTDVAHQRLRICKRCNKVLAVSVRETVETWTEV